MRGKVSSVGNQVWAGDSGMEKKEHTMGPTVDTIKAIQQGNFWKRCARQGRA